MGQPLLTVFGADPSPESAFPDKRPLRWSYVMPRCLVALRFEFMLGLLMVLVIGLQTFPSLNVAGSIRNDSYNGSRVVGIQHQQLTTKSIGM